MSEQQVAEWLAGTSPAGGLSPKLQSVYHVLQTQPSFASYASAAEVAERAGVNVATVTRCAQSLGFTGWPHLQTGLRDTFLSSRLADRIDIADSPVHAAIDRDLHNLHLAAQSVDPEQVRGFVDAIAGARRTVVLGFGTHAAVGHVLATLGANRGLDMVMVDQGGVRLANALAALGTDDCLVAISFWQYYRDTTTAIEMAREAGAAVCVLTDSTGSPAARLADHTLVVPTEGVSFFPSMTAALSVVYGVLADLVARRPDLSEDVGHRAAELLTRLNLLDRG